jgi:peptide/nickel transport system substrate-binding protein
VDFTSGGIYEPLVVVTPAGGGRQYNWLASRFLWSKDARTLTITVRPGVKWSDGEPLTNEDVVYSLTAGRQDQAMDQIGLTRTGNRAKLRRACRSSASRAAALANRR